MPLTPTHTDTDSEWADFLAAEQPTAPPTMPTTAPLDYTQYGFDEEYIRSPAQAFRTFATGFRPGWQRQAFYTQQPQLTQQYLLGLPASPQTFGDYLGQYTRSPMAGAELREQARRVADIQGMSQADWLAYLAGEGPEGFTTGLSPIEDVTYRDWYGAGSQNVGDLARALALQRGTGREAYQGIVGQAIGNVIDDLNTQYMGENPGGNFLEWYLDRSEAGGRLAF